MMETTLKPYLEHDRIDLPWQQHAPAHWTRLRLKHLLREVDERTQTGEETLMSLTRSRGLVRRSEITDKPPSAKTLIGYKVCRPGDIVMNRMQAWSGMFGLASEVGLVSPDYAVLRLIGKADGGFLLSLLKSPGPVSHFAALSTGMGSGFNRLYTDQLGAVPIATPPHEEQVQVARVTRDIDRRVNRLIRAKQRLIALLNEQKQAIIQRAVTRGLDPDVPLKPSGVDWLGDVPAHWDMMPNRASLKLKKDTVGARSSEYTLLSLTMQGVIPRDLENAKGKFPASFDAYQAVEPGDLVFCLFDIDETPRTVGAVEQRGMLTGAYTAFACEDVTTRNYLYYLYLALDYHKALKPVYTGLRKVIPKSTFLGLKSPIPPESERVAIIDFIRQSVREHDTAIGKAKAEIDLIREYRTRLIADVVTGKLDVRGVAVPEVDDALLEASDLDADDAENGELVPDDEALAAEEA